MEQRLTNDGINAERIESSRILLALDVLTNGQAVFVAGATSRLRVEREYVTWATREAVAVEVMQSLCDNSRRKDVDIRLAIFRGQIHAACEVPVGGNVVFGGCGVLLLQKPLQGGWLWI